MGMNKSSSFLLCVALVYLTYGAECDHTIVIKAQLTHCFYRVGSALQESVQKESCRKFCCAASCVTTIGGMGGLLLGAYFQNKALILGGCCLSLLGFCCIGILHNKDHKNCEYCTYRDHDFAYSTLADEEL